jgi:uncharacterized membrane protein YfcA
MGAMPKRVSLRGKRPDKPATASRIKPLNRLPDLAAISALLHEPRFIAAVAIAAVAGLVRGFSGFGSALIYMPLISALYGPRVAAPTLLLIDTICSLPFTVHAAPQCNPREVAWVSLSGFVFLPLGVMALVYIDAILLRWLIVALVAVALFALISGWRYHGKPTVTASLATGAFSGFGGGAVQIAAPPLLIFWLGGANKAATVRANIMVYFIPQAALSMALYYWNALFTGETVALALLFGLPFAAAMAAGVYSFHGSSEALYRRVAYVIIAFAGLVSMPIFDALR